MEIQIPTACPSCKSQLELVNSQLFCRNEACPAQSSKKLESFAKKMKIKGLGPATLEKLDVVGISELYGLTEEFLVAILGEKIGKKIFNEIDKTKTCDFATYLSALSIPLIGSTASEKIATAVNSLEDISEANLSEVGIGPKARENLLDWLDENIATLPKLALRPMKEKQTISSLGKVCITGKLNSFKNRNEAATYLKSLGYTATTTVSKQTDYLVDEEGRSSSKRTKAEQLNIPIVTIKYLEEKVNE